MNSSSEGKSIKKLISNNIKAILGVSIVLILVTLIAGIVLLCTCVTSEGYEIVTDYTNCTSEIGLSNNHLPKCKDVPEEQCTCYIPISITKPMKAPVTVFYELESYDQIVSNYSQSRDNNQLAGHLSPTVADSCGNYSYNTTEGKKPIAPCGGLADAMFSDRFSLITNNTYVPIFRTGLIPEEDKKLFYNPKGNLSEAFKNFSKPSHWRKNVYELDTTNPDNNGFRNEPFIIWMLTDLKPKPALRVNHTKQYEQGLPVGDYTLRVEFNYLTTSRYEGLRKCIISSKHEIVNSVKYSWGVALLVIAGVILILLTSIIIWIRMRSKH